MNFLTRKIGPLPAWGWAVIGLAGFLALRWFRSQQGQSSGQTGAVALPQPSPDQFSFPSAVPLSSGSTSDVMAAASSPRLSINNLAAPGPALPGAIGFGPPGVPGNVPPPSLTPAPTSNGAPTVPSGTGPTLPWWLTLEGGSSAGANNLRRVRPPVTVPQPVVVGAR